MKLNTIIKLPDGRIGTICWNNLDGSGGVWGRCLFAMPKGGFGGDLPVPDFMLRPKSLERILKKAGHKSDIECVGEDYEVIE